VKFVIPVVQSELVFPSMVILLAMSTLSCAALIAAAATALNVFIKLILMTGLCSFKWNAHTKQVFLFNKHRIHIDV